MLYAIGTYTDLGGPGVVLVDVTDRRLAQRCASRAVDNPIWIEQDPIRPDVLYTAANAGEKETGWVASFKMTDLSLECTSVQPTGGAACCHLALDESAEHLYAANYIDGSVSVFPLNNGLVLPLVQQLQQQGTGPNAQRQENAHAHQVTFRPGSDKIFVCDLGADRIVIYRRGENGLLSVSGSIVCPPGIGPRHLAFDRPDRFFLVGELGGWLALYDRTDSGWILRQLLPTVSEASMPDNTAAAIRMAGSRVYISNRGHDSIAVFCRTDDGLLSHERTIPVPGQYPRDFCLIGQDLLIACQNDGGLVLTDADGEVLDRLDIPGAVSILPLKGVTA